MTPHASDAVDERTASALARLAWPSAVASGLLLATAVLMRFIEARSLGVLLPAAPLGFLLWRAQPIASRQTWGGLFWSALAVRLVFLTTGEYAGTGARLPMLGSDGLHFWIGSNHIAAQAWQWPSPDVVGSIDTAHYFLFASMIRLFDANIFGIKLLNAGLDAITAPCTYAICLMVWPRRATLAGLLVAIYTPVIVLSTLDVWKDPTAVLGVMLAVWAVLRIAHERRWQSSLGFAVCLMVALAYVHATRSYWAFYLEVACASTAGLMLYARAEWRCYRTAFVVVATSVLASEAGAYTMGWPPSAVLFVDQVRYVSRTFEMRALPQGSMDRLVSDAAGEAGEPERRDTLLPETRHTLAPGLKTRFVAAALVIFRKVWGPYAWNAPPSLEPRDVLSGDYFNLPGMWIWYALLPSIGLGLAMTLTAAVRRNPPSWALVLIAIYGVVSFGHYLALNLAFRQRDGLFPLLVIFGLMGWHYGRRHQWWPYLHVAYGVGLLSLALLHLAQRSGNAS